MEDVARHDKMVSLVERMLDLNKRLAEAKTSHEKTLLQRKLKSTISRSTASSTNSTI